VKGALGLFFGGCFRFVRGLFVVSLFGGGVKAGIFGFELLSLGGLLLGGCVRRIPGRVLRLGLGHLAIDIYTTVFPAIIPVLVVDGGLSYLLAGLLLTAYNTTSSLVQPFFGWLFDAKGRAVPLALSMLAGGIAIGAFGLTTSVPVLLALAAVAGVMHAAFHPPALSIVSRAAPEGERAKTISYFVVGGNLGFALGPLLAGFALGQYGLAGLPLMAIPALLVAPLLVGAGIRPGTVPEQPPADAPPNRPRAFALLGAASVIRAWALFAVLGFMPAFLVSRGVDLVGANLITSAMLLAGVAGQLAGASLSDRFGRKEFVLAGLGLAIPAYAGFLLTGGAVSLVLLGLFGFGLWSTFAITVALSHELMPRSLGFASGMMLGVVVGAGGLGVAVTGYIADLSSLEFALWTVVPVLAASMLLYAILPYPWKAAEAQIQRLRRK
jgi:FSR family fosmidomycin resistance protein-like MFS transporter